VDGSEAPGFVLVGETEGDSGVKRPVKLSSKARWEGVFGNCMELMAIGLALNADILLGEGECPQEASMFGRAKDSFVGDSDDDALGAFTGAVGEDGVDKIFIEDGALGEADARS
jgi:hypothetical protein